MTENDGSGKTPEPTRALEERVARSLQALVVKTQRLQDQDAETREMLGIDDDQEE